MCAGAYLENPFGICDIVAVLLHSLDYHLDLSSLEPKYITSFYPSYIFLPFTSLFAD